MLEWVAIPFSGGIFPTRGSNLGLLALQTGSFTVWATRQTQLVPGRAPIKGRIATIIPESATRTEVQTLLSPESWCWSRQGKHGTVQP